MKKEVAFTFITFFIIVSVFFYPVYQGLMPFPGDLLVNTKPYSSLSLDGYAPGGIPHKAQGVDVIRELYPWKNLSIELIKKWELPLWNPYNFSGNPLMANFQSGSFYPLNLLFLLFSFNLAWTIYIFIIPLLSALFLYLFLREINLSRLTSVFGGLVFAFSSYMVVWMEYGNIGHVMLWLPLALLFTEKLIRSFSIKYSLLLIITLSTAILGGYIQGYFYTLCVIVYYYIFKSVYSKSLFSKKTILFFIFVTVPFLLTAFQILPTIELFQHSSRGNYTLEEIKNLLNPLYYIITVVAPDFFGNPASRNYWFYGTYIERVSYFGLIPFILALFALLKFRIKKEIVIFGSIFIGSFIFAFDFIFSKYIYLLPIPVMSTTVPTRILSLFVFSGAILGAIGFEFILKEKKRKVVYLAAAPVIILLIIAAIYAGLERQIISLRNLIMPFLFTGFFIGLVWLLLPGKSVKKLLIIAIFLITLFDLFRFFHKITPFSPQDYVYPETPVISYIQKQGGIWRYWGYGNGHLETNMQIVNRTYFPDGRDSLHLKSYTEFLASSLDGKIPSVISRSDAEVAPGYEVEELKNNYYRQKMLNILGVKYILLKDISIKGDPNYKPLWTSPSWNIYENTRVAPRAFLTNSYKIASGKMEIPKIFYAKDFDEKKSIILEKDPGIRIKPLKNAQIKLLRYEPSYIKFTVSNDAEALFYLSDAYYPGWNAYVDGNSTEIYEANYAFRAIKIPSGQHSIEFIYNPGSFGYGVIVSLITFTGLCVFFLLLKKIKI